MTRNGIEYDLRKSPYSVYNAMTGIRFYFSSNKYMEKFMNMASEETHIMNYAFKKKYLITIYTQELALINLYRKIEKRGFLIEIDSKFYKEPPIMEVVVESNGY